MARTLKPDIHLAAAELQLWVRVEEGAKDCVTRAVWKVDGKLHRITSPFGYCVCRTCACVLPYKGAWADGENIMHGCHMLGGRSKNPSVYIEKSNVYPGCAWCNAGHNKSVADAWRTWAKSCLRFTDKHGNKLRDMKAYDAMVYQKHDRDQLWTPTPEEIIACRVEWRAKIKAGEKRLKG